MNVIKEGYRLNPEGVSRIDLDDAPEILNTAAELSAGNRGRKRVSRNTNLLVHVAVSKVVLSVGHGSNGNADRVILRDRGQVVLQCDNRGIVREGYLCDTHICRIVSKK